MCIIIYGSLEFVDEVITTNEPIEPDVPVDQIRKEPYTLPDGFIWDTLDLEESSAVSARTSYSLMIIALIKTFRAHCKHFVVYSYSFMSCTYC